MTSSWRWFLLSYWAYIDTQKPNWDQPLSLGHCLSAMHCPHYDSMCCTPFGWVNHVHESNTIQLVSKSAIFFLLGSVWHVQFLSQKGYVSRKKSNLFSKRPKLSSRYYDSVVLTIHIGILSYSFLVWYF